MCLFFLTSVILLTCGDCLLVSSICLVLLDCILVHNNITYLYYHSRQNALSFYAIIFHHCLNLGPRTAPAYYYLLILRYYYRYRRQCSSAAWATRS